MRTLHDTLSSGGDGGAGAGKRPLDAAGVRLSYVADGAYTQEIVGVAIHDASFAVFGVVCIFVYVGFHTGSCWLAVAALLQVRCAR